MRFISLFLLFAGTLWLGHGNAPAQGFVHASGLYIADGSNNQIILRGMGLGGWLVPEGYMIGTSSFANSPTEFKNAVAALVGDANAEIFFTNYRANYVKRKDIDSLARWGFNSVRLPMHYGLLTSAPGVYVESGFATIDSLLDWCKANRMYLILDLHCAPGGQNSGNISDYQGPPSLWESATYQTWTTQLWKTLAARYVNEPWIGGYDLLNETAWSFPSGNKPLRDLLVRITDSIRAVDRNHMIFAEGNWYATDFSGLAPAWDANMAWSFHKYWNTNDYNAFVSFLNLRADTQRPLWLGESGENSNQWFSDAITLSEFYKIGWSWWTLKKIESTSCPLSVTKSPAYDALLRYWNGQAPKPSVADAMNALNGQAALLDASLCTRRPDFINALFGTPTPNQRKPYADNVIPGPVHAVDYDMGKNQIAYADVDFQNTGGNGGPAYNTGGTYRNDGVDIERCSDPGSNGYSVGWTSAGEFLTYTVRVEKAGSYNISVRAASANSGGSIALVWDGGETLPLAIPGTGGWQNWQTVNLGNYSLDAGTHDFQVKFISGGYNLGRTIFTLIATDVPAASVGSPLIFGLEQNYPNPFNPSTVIRFTLPAAGLIRLTVCDLLGRVVATPAEGRFDAGLHEVTFDASGLSSGIYICRLQGGGTSLTRTMTLVK